MTSALFEHTRHQELCPQCGSPLQIRQSKKGLFLGCSGYPNCDYLKPLQPYNASKILKQLDEICPECGKNLQLKTGNYGMFIGCSGYPDCRFVVHDEAEPAQKSFPCPECKKGELVARRGHRGKSFYGCNRFPACKFTVSGKLYAVGCPQCGGSPVVLKKQTETHRVFVCLNKSCKHQFNKEL
ncbi:topoisomerase DNA-binding C4 zinc finger domain-containing protein [Actinobacillus sp. GY-402]|nr:topoisomerase DNA-binding C4 zinc finger domain-containing protein [Actinobacillus sp. GY-402]